MSSILKYRPPCLFFSDLVTGLGSANPVSTARGLSAKQREACMRSLTTQKPKQLPRVETGATIVFCSHISVHTIVLTSWCLFGARTSASTMSPWTKPHGWTPFYLMYENSTLCTKCCVHQANAAGAFTIHQANAAGTCIMVHQRNVAEHFGSYIK